MLRFLQQNDYTADSELNEDTHTHTMGNRGATEKASAHQLLVRWKTVKGREENREQNVATTAVMRITATSAREGEKQ